MARSNGGNDQLSPLFSTLSVNLINVANAKTKFMEKYYGFPLIHNKSIRDFVTYQMLGKGAFATVLLAMEIDTDKEDNEADSKIEKNNTSDTKANEDADSTEPPLYAMKIQNKERILKEQQLEHVKSEKKILSSVESKFIIEMTYAFQDTTNVYMAFEYMAGGELYRFLRTRMYFGEETVKFYSMQIILAVEYLHQLDVVYRDIKPENILIGTNGYLKLADFGFAKMLLDYRTYTLCGTPEYLAPEIILNRGYGQSVDWWSIGVLIFELLVGHTPFCAQSSKSIYSKITECRYKFPPHVGIDAKSLIKKLIEPDPTRRLGNLRYKAQDIKEHKWFKYNNKTTWEKLFDQTSPLPQEIISRKIKPRPVLLEDNITELELLDFESASSREYFQDW